MTILECDNCKRDFDPNEIGSYRLHMSAPGHFQWIDDRKLWFCNWSCLKGWVE